MSVNSVYSKNRKEKIKSFKSNYKTAEEIFNQYLIFKQRLNYEDVETFPGYKYWKRYIGEINGILECMSEKERDILTERFLNKKNISAMYISNSKYYHLMNIAVEKFLIGLEAALLDPKHNNNNQKEKNQDYKPDELFK